MNKIEGAIHVHTEQSLNDSSMTIPQYVKRAKELGMKVLTLTNHGNVLGMDTFISECEANGIQPMPGCEVYYKETLEDVTRKHLLLLAVNFQGYKDICDIVTAGNRQIQKGFPIVTKDILEQYKSDNIIVSSACIAGVVADCFLSNKSVQKKIDRLDKTLSTLTTRNDDTYLSAIKKRDKYDKLLSEMIIKRDTLDKKAKKKITKDMNKAKKENDTEKFNKLNAIQKEIDQAGIDAKAIRIEIASLKKEITKNNQYIKKAETAFEKSDKVVKEKNVLLNLLLSEDEAYQKAIKIANDFKSMFKNFYIEVQYHGIPEEKMAYPLCAKVARECNIPLLATNDAHIVDNTHKPRLGRQIMRSLRFNQYEEEMIGDNELYLKTSEQIREMLLQILDKDVVDEAINNISNVLKACVFKFEFETHYPKFLDKNGIHPNTEDYLRNQCIKGINNLLKDEWNEEYQTRLDYELKTIHDMGFDDYLCIVQDFIRKGRELSVDNPEHVGLGIGPGRGSAAGSLVCYLTRITSINPMKYGLLFERFLNKDRVSMPDIDTDFAKFLREDVIQYVKGIYGVNAVCQIATESHKVGKGAIRDAARIYGNKIATESKTNDKSTIEKKYLVLGDEIAKKYDDEAEQPIIELRKLFTSKEEQDILDWADAIIGLLGFTGVHAAGVIISDNDDVSKHVPLLYDTKQDTWKTACDMVQCEEVHGLLKMDFLGLKTLDVITDCLRMIKRNHGIVLDAERLPLDDENVFREIFAKGNTIGVFQYESNGMQNTMKNFGPEKFEDLILLNAIFRPGPLQYIDDVTAVHAGTKTPHYIANGMEEILSVTYGYPIYQEQIMQLLNKVAGFSLGESDIIRRYMSKKKVDKFIKYEGKFIDGMIASGAKREEAKAYWDELVDFSRYAFNKSHACAYAFVAYISAWLKHYYPAEFLAAQMNIVEFEKIGPLIQEAKRLGVHIVAPDVNRSSSQFTSDQSSIYFGFESIKGFPIEAASIIVDEREANGEYTDFKSFMVRTGIKVKTKLLIQSGAFDSIAPNRRTTMMLAFNDCLCEASKIIARKKQALTEEGDKIKKSEDYIKLHQQILDEIEIIDFPDDKLECLNTEAELLGIYVSGHPIDAYDHSKYTSIVNLEKSYRKEVFGMISDVKKIVTKNSQDMAFVTIEDGTGTLDIVVFPQQFQRFGDKLTVGSVFVFSGKIEEKESFQDETVMELSMIANNINTPVKIQGDIMLEIPSITKWEETQKTISSYLSTDGYRLHLFDALTNEVRKTSLYVNGSILDTDLTVQCI